MKETTFEKIMRKTGRKPVSCKCEKCRSQCQTISCKGTPEDIEALIAAGYADRLQPGVTSTTMTGQEVFIIMPKYDKAKGCTFYRNGLCELHDLGLKPTEGKLSHHSTTREDVRDKKKLVTYHILKEWEGLPKERLQKMVDAIIAANKPMW